MLFTTFPRNLPISPGFRLQWLLKTSLRNSRPTHSKAVGSNEIQPPLQKSLLTKERRESLHAAAVATSTIHSHYRRKIPEAISSRQANTMTLDQRERSEPVVVFAKRKTGLSFKIKMV